MKRLILTIVATIFVATIGFANTNEPVNEKKEVKEKKSTSKESSSKENGEVKVVFCTATINGVLYYYEYTCFFCWGGAEQGCKAELLDFIQSME